MVAMKPAWLQGLIGETYFGACMVHETRKKNEKNIFCLNCCLSICPHCLPSHPSHPLLQVRRYVYHDVVRLGDLEKLIDCSYIQPYTINGAKVIFLNHRPQSRSCKGPANFCYNCDRILQEPFHFCSLSCKVDYLVYQGENLSGFLPNFHESEFAISQFEGSGIDVSGFTDDDSQFTSSSILADPFHLHYKGSACSSNAMANSRVHREPDVAMTAKKKGSGFFSKIVLPLSNRRKGAPQRAPLS